MLERVRFDVVHVAMYSPRPGTVAATEMIDNIPREEKRRRLHEVEELQKRIHLLEGFRKIYDALDDALKIIRKSDGKADAAVKLSKRFGLDDLQTDAILELKLYKLARLEIQAKTPAPRHNRIAVCFMEPTPFGSLPPTAS